MFVSVRAQKYADALWAASHAQKIEDAVASVLAGLLFGANAKLSQIATVKTLPPRTHTSAAVLKLAKLSEEKQNPLSHVFGRFLTQLIMHGCVKLLPQVARAYYERQLQSQGKFAVTVRGAQALTSTRLKELTNVIERQSGMSAEIIFEEAPELLGGVEVIANGIRYDMSLLGRLNRIRKTLHTVLDTQEI